jgi:hypothetical protein
MLRIVGLFGTDVLGISIGPIFKGQAVQEGQFGPSRWDQYVVPKRPCRTNLRCVTSQKTKEFRQTAVEAYDPVRFSLPRISVNEQTS